MRELLPHQQVARQWMTHHHRLILWHATGTGKSLTSLAALRDHLGEIAVIGPGSARRAWMREVEAGEVDPERLQFHTFSSAKMMAAEDITVWQGLMVIVDEAHYLRTENMQNLQLISAIQMARKVILATATPIVNSPADLAVLVNLVRGSHVLPTEPRLWDSLYYDPEERRVKNPDRLGERLRGTISRYDQVDRNYYPEVVTHVHRVVMSRAQLDAYASYVRRYIYGSQPLSETALLQVDWETLATRTRNYFLTATRQISNTADGEPSPKLQEVWETIREGPRPAVVFSFYLERGLHALAALLEEEDVRWASITGATGKDMVIRTVEIYNRGGYDVLLLSSAGGESLDLRGTRQVHVLEGQWNPSKTTQAEGRAVRYGSHLHLPQAQRQVDVHYWLSVFPPHVRNLSADEYLWQISEEKRRLAEEYLEIITRASIERSPYSTADDLRPSTGDTGSHGQVSSLLPSRRGPSLSDRGP